MEHRRYITRRRARFQSMSGPVNLPWGTEAENRDGFLWRGDNQLCAASAQNTKEFFVQDDDGQGQERGQLVNAILDRLGPREVRKGASGPRWEKIWTDPQCRRYKRPEDEEYWLWNEDFYNAPIKALRHIAGLVGVKDIGKISERAGA